VAIAAPLGEIDDRDAKPGRCGERAQVRSVTPGEVIVLRSP